MKKEKTIGVFDFKSSAGPWDPDSMRTGLLDPEEALVHMSQSLSELGFKVIVFADPPLHSSHSIPSANPRFIDCEKSDDFDLDIAIAWRSPNMGPNLKKMARKVYFCPQDIASFHHITDDEIRCFDDVLWVSEYSRNKFLSLHPGFAKFTTIYGNGIKPEQFNPIQNRENPYSCIYSSCWKKGLWSLLDIWPKVKQEFPKATLDIYDFSHGLSSENERKAKNLIASLDGVFEHGRVGHDKLIRAFEKSSFWTYPCAGEESFCATALKAQFSGAIPVVVQNSALNETVLHGYTCQKIEDYLATLLEAMKNAEKITLEDRRKIGEFVLDKFTWRKIALKWKTTFENHLDQVVSSSRKKIESLQEKEKYLKEIKILEKAIEEDPTNSFFVLQLAFDYALVNDDLQALKCFKKKMAMGGSWLEDFISSCQISLIQKKLAINLENVVSIPKVEQIYAENEFLISTKDYVLGYFASQSALLISQIDDSYKNFGKQFLRQFVTCAYEIEKYEEANKAKKSINNII